MSCHMRGPEPERLPNITKDTSGAMFTADVKRHRRKE